MCLKLVKGRVVYYPPVHECAILNVGACNTCNVEPHYECIGLTYMFKILQQSKPNK